jgi:uncharacterized YigZ family protein
MLQNYLSLAGVCETQKTIEKSKFITTSAHVVGEDEARDFVAEISKKYSDATHNCYAYISDNLGNMLRFSDNGEPQGTAGMPMLEVIKANNLCEVAVVVTRYFGGIKLGAGGLVRAYSGCVSENIKTAKKVLYDTCTESDIIVDYSAVDTATKYFLECGANILNTDYANDVTYKVAVKKSAFENFKSALINRLNGRVKINFVKEYFYPFEI